MNVPGLKFNDAVGATPRGSRTLVFLATYNERSNIAALLDAILNLPVACDVLVVDDNSPDGTARFVAERAAADPRIQLLVRPKRLGIGSARRLGWLHARRFGYGRVVTMDADMSHQPADIPRLLRALDEGADVALGSRFAPGGKLDYQGWRLFLSRTANWLARKSLGLPLKEYTNSFRAARLDKLPLGLIEGLTNNGYGFFLAETVRTARQGLRVVEVPIHFHDRNAGRSKMPKFQIVLGVANFCISSSIGEHSSAMKAIPVSNVFTAASRTSSRCIPTQDNACSACATTPEMGRRERFAELRVTG